MNLNIKKRKFENKKYKNYILQLPDLLTGEPSTDPHHVDIVGRERVKNDFYAIPLSRKSHNLAHSDPGEFRKRLGEDPRDYIIYLLSLRILEYQGEYSLIEDREMGFSEFRRQLDLT